jgi:Reverse transcriptase (RNA-dependent DNA polymerase)
MHRPDMRQRPFRLSNVRLNAEDSLLMEEVIAERLAGRMWEELTPEQARSAKYVSRVFVARDADGAGRSVGDFSQLSDHYSAVLTMSDTLKCFSVSMRRHDKMLSMDLRSGYKHIRLHPAMRDYFVVPVNLMDDTVKYFRYLILPFGWSRSGYWFSRLVSRFWTTIKSRFGYRVLSYMDDYLICPSTGRASTKMDHIRASARLEKLLFRYGLTRHPKKCVLGGASQVLQHLGFVIDSVRGSFGVPANKLDKVSSMAQALLRRVRCNACKVPEAELESFVGKAQSLRLVVPETAFRLRALYDVIPPRGPSMGSSVHQYWSRSFSSRSRSLEFVSQLRSEALYRTRYARISYPAVSDLQFCRDLPKHLHHRPILPSHPRPTTTIHTDFSLSAFGATLGRAPLEAGSEGFYEMSSFWDTGCKQMAHITPLELSTIRLALQEFVHLCALQPGEVIRMYTDSQVTMHVINSMVSRSSTLMAELRRPHNLFLEHNLTLEMPSALNLFPDRWSRRRRAFDNLPSLPGMREHWWVGASEHDMKTTWGKVELQRPPLDLMAPWYRRR